MEPLLELRAVTKVYGVGRTEVRAVDGVDLRLGAGEIMLIMGPSGSGKTTLLSMAGLLLSPTGGEIRINGRGINGRTRRELALLRLTQIGFVFQSYNLLSALSACENVEVVMNLAGKTGKAARGRETWIARPAGRSWTYCVPNSAAKKGAAL